MIGLVWYVTEAALQLGGRIEGTIVTLSVESAIRRKIGGAPRRMLFGTAAPVIWGAGLALVASAALAQVADSAGRAGREVAAPTGKAAEASSEVDSVVVTAERSPLLVAEKSVAATPGATNVIDVSKVEKGAVFTNQDILAYQPGVYALAAGGSDGLKLSVRGSGVNTGTNYFRAGVLLLFDGLPVTGPGGTPYELFEPLGLSSTVVLRGANGEDVGAATLGGAINYISKTGRDFDSLGQLRVESGSWNYHKYQLSSGHVFGPFDYYISLTDEHRDGFQRLTEGSAQGAQANFGWQITPDIENRVFVRYRKTNNQQPGALTAAQIARNPSQANPTNIGLANTPGVALPFREQPGSTWVGDKLTFRFDDGSVLDIGGDYHNYPINISSTIYAAIWGYRDVSGSINYSRKDTLFGLEDVTKVGVLATDELDAFQNTYVRVPSPTTLSLQSALPAGQTALSVSTLLRRATYGGSDVTFHFANALRVAQNLWITAGFSALDSVRSTEVVSPTLYYFDPASPVTSGTNAGTHPLLTNIPYNKTHTGVIPRIGFRFDPNPSVEFFGNFTQSIEPPRNWELLTGTTIGAGTPHLDGASVGNEVFATPTATSVIATPAATLNNKGIDLKDQTATTFEIGGKGDSIIGRWTLALYHSDVHNELVQAELSPAVGTIPAITATFNASPTVHQGVEASLDTVLWRSDGQKLSLHQDYTYGDYHFVNDPQFHHNQLPGLPAQYYQAYVTYEHPSGFYGTLNVRAASGDPVDYANTSKVRPYHIVGFDVGYEPPGQKWSVFLTGANIGNAHYASTVSPGYNDAFAGQAGPGKVAHATPGDLFNLVGGVTVRF